MPASDYHHISDVLHIVEQHRPTTVLDVGVGFGKWGVLCREVLDIYQGRFYPHEWTAKIEGVEIFDGYRNPLWEFAYNRIFTGDAFEILESLGDYELVLACDILEHFEKEKGKIFLRKLLERGRVVILTSPRDFLPQEVFGGNEYERHQSLWSRGDFSQLGFPFLYKEISSTFMAVLSLSQDRLKPLELYHPLRAVKVEQAVPEFFQMLLQRWERKTGR